MSEQSYERRLSMNDLLSKERLERLSLFYKMFGDPTRIRILGLLNDQKCCVSEIAEALHMTQSSISHQLQTLRYASFVTYEKQGKEVFYSLADDHIKILLQYGLEHIMEGETK